MLLCRRQRRKSPQILAPSSLGVFLAGIQTITCVIVVCESYIRKTLFLERRLANKKDTRRASPKYPSPFSVSEPVLSAVEGRLRGKKCSHHEILRPRMMHHQRRSTLLRLQQKPRGQPHSHILLRLQQDEQLRLILQIRARRIPKRIPRPAILLMEQIANRRRILARNPQLLAHRLMMQLRQPLRRLHAQPVQI